MTEEKAKRKLTAILSADVKGYSHLMQDDEEATVRTITAYRGVMSTLIQEHDGRVVDAKGDNVLAEFASVVDAVRCAVEIQKELKVRNDELPENRKMAFRIGINLGDVIEEEGTIYGDGVNIAARLEGLAEGGGICISRMAFDNVKNKLDVGYEYLGEHSVKNIAELVRVYKVLMEPEYAGKVVGEERPKPKQWRWAAIGAVAILIIVAGIFAIWNFYLRPDVEPASIEKMAFPLPEKPSLAVLPFDNLSGNPEQDYLVDGLTENIITGLSKIPDMFVIARNSTFTYKGKPVKVQQIAEDLGVRYVLEGSVQKSGEQLRVTAQLIDALQGHHVWSETYDRKMEELFAVQDDITLNIAVAMQVKLTEGEQARVRHSTNNLEAWALAVKAHGLFETYAREDNAKARELFKKAVGLDPNYAYAWAYLGWTYWIDGVYHSAHYDRKKSFESSSKMAEKALSVDNKSSDAHALLGAINLSQKKYDEAEAFGKKTIDLDPNSSENHAIVAITMQNIGKFEEAIALVKQAMRLNPYYPNWYLARLGMCYQMVGMYEKSAASFEELGRRYRKKGTAAPLDRLYLYLASTYSMMGRLEEARDFVSKSLEFNPKMTVGLWRKRFQYKDPEHTERILDALRKAGLTETPPLPLPDKPSIAVLPFVNMSGDPEQGYFSDGISEQIITFLSKVSGLFVIARTSSFKYKGKEVDVRDVGRELGVRYVLEGSVQRSGERVRINGQLIDASTGHHLWAERYDRDLKDIFEIQDDITKQIIAALNVKLTIGGDALQIARGTDSLEAYLKYLQARERHMRFTKEDNLASRGLVEEAISIDPEFGVAYSFLAMTHFLDVVLQATKSPGQSITKAIELARKGVALSDAGHDVLGFLYLNTKKYDKAIAECERAVHLDPNSATAHTFYGLTLTQTGHFEDAVDQLEQGVRLDPTSSFGLRSLAIAYSFVGRHEEAIATCKKAIQKAPKDLVSHIILTRAYSMAGRIEEARNAAAEVLRINPNFSLESYAKRVSFKNQAHRDRVVEALRDAGLK